MGGEVSTLIAQLKETSLRGGIRKRVVATYLGVHTQTLYLYYTSQRQPSKRVIGRMKTLVAAITNALDNGELPVDEKRVFDNHIFEIIKHNEE